MLWFAPQWNGCRRFVGVVLLGKPLRILARPVSDLLPSGRKASGRVKCGVCGRGPCSRGFFLPGGVSRALAGRVPSGSLSFRIRSTVYVVGCARRRASLGGCVYGRSDSVPPCEGAKSGRTECSAASESGTLGRRSSECRTDGEGALRSVDPASSVEVGLWVYRIEGVGDGL